MGGGGNMVLIKKIDRLWPRDKIGYFTKNPDKFKALKKGEEVLIPEEIVKLCKGIEILKRVDGIETFKKKKKKKEIKTNKDNIDLIT